MISLTKLDGREVVVNADHILAVEPTPDTVILLTTGLKLMVREGVEDVVDLTAAWRRRIHGGPELKGVVLPFPAERSEE
jgi:flagellar protein FlbD